MAWVAEEDFNSYADGDLTGGNGGSGWSNTWGDVGSFQPNFTDVQGTTVYEGAKAVRNAGGVSAIGRTLTTALTTGNSGIIYLAIRRTTTAGTDGCNISFRNVSDQSRMKVEMNNSGNIIIEGTVNQTVLAGYSADTWYVIRLTYNMTLGTYSGAYSTDAYGTAGTFSSESGTATMTNTGDIAWVVLNGGDSNTGLHDYISATSPFTAVAAGGRDARSLSLLGVG